MRKKKFSKRVIAYLISVVLCFALFGCSSEADYSESSSETTQEVLSTAVESQGTSEGTVTETAEPEVTETEEQSETEEPAAEISSQTSFDLSEVPEYSGLAYVAVNDNVPFFTDSDLTTESYEYYSDLDSLGRCGVAIANIGQDIMPTEERGAIGSVKPTGWHTVKYDIVDGNYLYNRCHLIGYQLSGENANEKNLITGTRYLNVEGMLPFENMVADYVEETNNHVLYRVTPVFDGDNLVASGVLMEAMSVEDDGDGILFNVYCYNVQPGVSIDYATGDSWLEDEDTNETTVTAVTSENTEETTGETSSSGTTYILNTNTKKFHYPDCSSVSQMSEKNKKEYTGNRDDLISQGYSPCGNCNP
ncbi:MAG: DNA/RNA non-specific endonuclease [Clostridiales bacterium]|nr:DNA/RNA non-specific endonuclease [Clostridiales bacterium]